MKVKAKVSFDAVFAGREYGVIWDRSVTSDNMPIIECRMRAFIVREKAVASHESSIRPERPRLEYLLTVRGEVASRGGSMFMLCSGMQTACHAGAAITH